MLCSAAVPPTGGDGAWGNVVRAGKFHRAGALSGLGSGCGSTCTVGRCGDSKVTCALGPGTTSGPRPSRIGTSMSEYSRSASADIGATFGGGRGDAGAGDGIARTLKAGTGGGGCCKVKMEAGALVVVAAASSGVDTGLVEGFLNAEDPGAARDDCTNCC